MPFVISWIKIGIYDIENVIKNILLDHSDRIKRTLVPAALTALWAGDKAKMFALLGTPVRTGGSVRVSCNLRPGRQYPHPCHF